MFLIKILYFFCSLKKQVEFQNVYIYKYKYI